MSIEVSHLVKRFSGGSAALNDVSFTIQEGEMIGFLGPSGSGKTTLLRLIAGLDKQNAGEIRIRGQVIDHLSPQKRGVGFVFQNYALFKHMSVFENIAFGLRVQKQRPAEIKARVHDLLDLVHLPGLEHRYPNQLSGGQAQRVALARALAPKPSILLLDEPFAAIDTKIRRELRKWVRQVHDEIGITSIFVTHDQEEALEIADRVLVMHQGRVEQLGTPQEVYDAPKSLFVADFVGEANQFVGVVQSGKFALGPFALDASAKQDGQEVRAIIRPADVRLTTVSSAHDVVGKVIRASYKGNFYGVDVRLTDTVQIQAYVDRKQRDLLIPGQRVAISIQSYRLFD
ncbi:sulfate/molybdate ABC transporter ATP-binding protein [Alicyclobacillus fodiniaquatilis]|jgi:sulfate transport system ATP-binding protein|uniref:Sulfate/molybdate ABC transporter ATP-binding protein n=1 Tax=Alicyclobacillus fodiniaquatilis TaxID=1661150 RepID=A0ABW4JL23_9BACL